METEVFNLEKIKESEDGSLYKVSIKLKDIGYIDYMNLKVVEDNSVKTYPLKHVFYNNEYNYFEESIFLKTKAVYKYFFEYKMNNSHHYINNNGKNYKLSVNFRVPDWSKGAVMYQIFVDRFNCSSKETLKPMKNRIIKNWNDKIITGPGIDNRWNIDFYGGNLKGIEEKLDYIKSLGTSIIYLTPIFESQSNHRYDTADFRKVDPYAGTNDDLKSLCDKIHEKEMKIVLDVAFNHTGSDSKYFNRFGTYDTVGAYQSDKSPYFDFYQKQFTNHGNCHFNYWWGMDNMPECDCYSPAWQNYITGERGVIDDLFSLGIDGLRLDVADELSDDFIMKIREAVKRNKEDGLVLGEVWKNPFRMNREYISSGKGLDTTMNYPLVDALIRYFKYQDDNKLKNTIDEILNDYPDDTINSLMNFSSTHDISRALTIFGSYDFLEHGEWCWDPVSRDINWCREHSLSKAEMLNAIEKYKAYLFTLTFMPGILSIFYGDEAGLTGIGNLENRKPFNWDNINDDILGYVKYLGNIRKKEQFLREAKLNLLYINKELLVFERKLLENQMLVAVNRTSEYKEINTPNEYKDGSLVYTLNNSNEKVLYPRGAIAVKNKLNY